MRRPEGGRFSIVTLTDIADQKRTKEKLRAANVRLEQHQREIEQDLVLAARIRQSLAPKPFLWGKPACRHFLPTGAHDWRRLRLGHSIQRRTPESTGLQSQIEDSQTPNRTALRVTEPHCTLTQRNSERSFMSQSSLCVPQNGHATANPAVARWQRDPRKAVSARHPTTNQ
jgi:hypothetical protein